jgi:hypothetical protein
LRDEFCAASFDEVDQGWIHVAVVVGYVEDNDELSAEVFTKFGGEFGAMAFFHNTDQISPLNLLG